MKIHEQHSDHSRVWYDLTVVDNQDGTLSIPMGSCWVHDVEYVLPSYNPNVGVGAFRLWVEKTDTGADYLLDLIGAGVPNSFGEGIGALLVAWKDYSADVVHSLRSIV